MKQIAKVTYKIILHIFALVGLILVGGFFAIRLHLTDVKGSVDANASKFSQMVLGVQTEKAAQQKNSNTLDSQLTKLTQIKMQREKNICQIDAIGQYAPVNAKNILTAFAQTQSDTIASKMNFAASLRLKERGLDASYNACDVNQKTSYNDYDELASKYANTTGANLFPWMNDEQWVVLKQAIAGDKDKIDRAAQNAGVEPRLVVASAIVEQLRLYHSQRGLFKQFFEPLKILGNANKISLGIMGVKEATAIQTENNLRDPNSPYYLGKDMEHALDFTSSDPASERYKRLTDDNDHYYSYLYGAMYMREMMEQWKRAGYDMQYRPEIVGTLFNVGFPQSHPNGDPKVGGSEINVGDAKYSFGSLAYEFYYSGELLDVFPYQVN